MIMKKMILWALAVIFVCSASVFTSCSNDDDDMLTSIRLNKGTLALTVGQTETLTATITPSDAKDATYTWSSDNTAIATVDANGLVTAVAVGKATISATANNGSGVKGVCAVTVSLPQEEK
jgi:uncharacterized protein YjdB